MEYLIRKEYAEEGSWSECLVYHKDRDKCFQDVKASLRDRRLMRIYVYESIDPELWRDKKLTPETLRRCINDQRD